MKFEMVNPNYYSRPTTPQDAEQVAALLNHVFTGADW